jgi:hypothetical protein
VSQEMTDFVPIKHALILMFYNLVARPNYPWVANFNYRFLPYYN